MQDASPPIDIRSLDLGGDVVIVTDRDGTIIDVNEAFVRVTGYSRHEAIGQTPRLLSSGYQERAFYEDLWATVTRGEVWEGQLIDRRRDGELRTHRATISPVKDSAGRVTHFVAVERDITADLGGQAALGSNGLVHTDHTGSCVYADARAAELFGTTPASLLGPGLTDRFEPDDAAAFRELISASTKVGRRHRMDVRRRGSVDLLHVELAPLTVASGTIIGTACAFEDLSERLAVHRELDRRDAVLDSVLDALPDAVAVVAGDGTVMAVNRAWRRLRAATPDDAVLAASVGDDLEDIVRRSAEQRIRSAEVLLAQIRRVHALGGDVAEPSSSESDDAGSTFAVTPLAWDEGGYVLRVLVTD